MRRQSRRRNDLISTVSKHLTISLSLIPRRRNSDSRGNARVRVDAADLGCVDAQPTTNMAAIVTGSRSERCILVDPFSRRPNGETLIYARRVRCANRGQRRVMCDETSCAHPERGQKMTAAVTPLLHASPGGTPVI